MLQEEPVNDICLRVDDGRARIQEWKKGPRLTGAAMFKEEGDHRRWGMSAVVTL
jgi:hypothetical protein